MTVTNTYTRAGHGLAAAEVLRDAQASRFVIEDFRPLAESVEWKLGLLDYENGCQVFGGDRPIPSTINNDGNFSLDAAEIFFHGLQAAENQGILSPQIRVLELGPGLGLFGRYFLDAFRGLCFDKGKDYYDRLTYVVGDLSEKMLADIGRRGVFANHLGHYELRVVDALRPDEYLCGDCNTTGIRFHAIFLNYLLDALPATALKLDTDGRAIARSWVIWHDWRMRVSSLAEGRRGWLDHSKGVHANGHQEVYPHARSL